MLDKRVKKILDDIIDVAYGDQGIPEQKFARFKWFKLRILPKEYKTMNGHYVTKEHLVEVFNAYRGVTQIAKTCIHEVAHHIVHCLYGIQNVPMHGKEFYDVYAHLIYAALDMNIMEPEELIDLHSGDHKKVEKILEEYDPDPVEYQMEDPVLIKVMNGYKVKDILKEHGYRWNNMEQVWELLPEEDKTEDEVAFLKSNNISGDDPGDRITPWYIVEDNGVKIDAYVLIEAKGDTYALREKLKSHGFTFNTPKKKAWTCKVKASEYNDKIAEIKRDTDLQSLEIKRISRKIKKQKKTDTNK